MPKPIKKKVIKKVSTEEDVKDAYESVKSFYEENTKNVQMVVAVLIVLILTVSGIFFYFKNISVKSSVLQSEAYKSYLAAVEQDDKDLYNEALDKFKEAYEFKRSPLLLYYESDIYQRTGETDKAISSLNLLVELFPSDEYVLPLGYSKLGSLYALKGDYEKALSIYAALEGSNLPAYRDLALYQTANIHKKMGNEDEVDRYNKLLLEYFPGSPYASEVEAVLKAKEAKEKEEAESNDKEKVESKDTKE
ncbi:MAG: tetratricopeptide repeat protein [Thermodesulfovibrionales bacterium]